MKGNKFLVALTAILLLVFTTSCLGSDGSGHAHLYKEWAITTAPTETETGILTRSCSCGEKVEKEIPALSNVDVWSVTETVDATCVTNGHILYDSKYGSLEVVIPATGHSYGEWTIVKEATETEDGEASHECACGHVETVSIPVLGEEATWEVTETVNPTCTEKGSKTYTSVYGSIVVELKETGHTYGEWTITTKPSFTEAGEASHTCHCEHVETVSIPALTDTTVWTMSEKVESTCSVKGHETYTSVYGSVTVELALGEHTYGEWTITTKPTLTEAGQASHTCVCNDVENVSIPALTDTAVWTMSEKVESTCTVKGHETYTSVYGSVTVELALGEHAYGEWTITTKPTLTEAGEASHACECGDEETTAIAALNDKAVWSVIEEVAADYNKAGKAVYESVYGQVEITVAKLVAPYDNKTYSDFGYDAEGSGVEFKNGVVGVETAWNHATITLDANGQGVGTAFPFRGFVTITMVNAETGEILITTTAYETAEDGQPLYDENGKIVLNEENIVKTVAYVDFETGLIVRPYLSNFNDILVLTPYESGVDGTKTNASSFDNSIAVEYTYNGTTHNIFVHKDYVYFGVDYKDAEGNAVVAKDAYKQAFLYVEKDGQKLFGFAHNGEKLVEADGYEGTYTNGADTLVVSGYGAATLNGEEATYVVNENTLGLYVAGAYYEVTLNGQEYTSVKPMVTIKFEASEYATIEDQEYNINVPANLPEPEYLTHTFKGWYLDSACTIPAGEEFVPTENATLYALWKTKVIINLVGVKEGDNNILYLGEGDVIGQALPQYSMDLEAMKVFKGWYLDSEYQTSLPEEVEVTEEDSNITIYAKWEDLPAYYGSYKGVEVWGETSGNSYAYSLAIDENGKISGKFSGIVTGYNAETGVISWKVSASATAEKYFWFNDELDIILTHYSSQTEIGTDFYIFGKGFETGKVNAQFGINAVKAPGLTVTGYYARLMNITTATGSREIFVYNNHIYANVAMTTTTGTVVTAANVKDQKTLIVKDLDTNEVVFSVASLGASFDENNKTTPLDEYFGTYTNGSETVVLDGTGTIIYGEKTGTYTKAVEGAEYGFEVYLENGSEYYQLTLNGDSYTLVKPTVLLTFVTGEGHIQIPAQEYNINVVATLPSGEDEGYVFNGWYLDAEFTTEVPASYIPTKAVNIYAKYSAPAVLTIVYNNGEEALEVVYSVGDTAIVEMPIYAKHAFVGWYTTEDFQEGTEWVSETVINSDTTIYAKWEAAPVYNNTYVPTEIDGVTADGAVSGRYTRTAAIGVIDPYGKGPKSGYPFSGELSITDYNEETQALVFNVGSSAYHGFIDPETGIIVLSMNKGANPNFDKVFLLSPFETKSIVNSISSSYWNSGFTRTIEYTYDGTTYSVFVFNNQVYFNVSFTDAEGNAVAGDECYHTSTLYVKDSEGEVIAKFGYDGTTMQFMDGYEGTYANGTDTLVLDGVKVATLNGVAGTYAKAESEAYTFDVYVGGEFFEVTVDKDAYTYTINKPMVTITFEAGTQATVEAVTVNKNIAITLPTPTNDSYVFRGWFADSACTQEVEAEYVPTATTTIYAKWDALAILTVVYGKGLENQVISYGVGDMANPTEPNFTDGQVFDGWYLDAELTTPYTPAAMEGSITIYAKWKDAIALYGEYAGYEIWGSTKAGGTTYGGSSAKKLSVDANGNVSGYTTGTITDYNPETGYFKLTRANGSYYYGYYDLESGAVVINYSSNNESLGNDIYVFVKGATGASTSGSLTSYWNSGYDKLINMNLVGHEKSQVYAFLHNNVLYFDVTFTSTDGEVTAVNAYKANQLTVYDSEGNVIANFVKGANGLELAA